MDPFGNLGSVLSITGLFNFTNDSDDESSDKDKDDVAKRVPEMLAIFHVLRDESRYFKWIEDCLLVWDAYVGKLEHKKKFNGTLQISCSSLYCNQDVFLDACIAMEELVSVLPTTPEELHRQSKLFVSKALADIFRGCVMTIDGILIPIQCPTVDNTNNTNINFSGHYKHLGLNCQAIADHCGKFLSFAVAAPGSSSDSRPYNELTSLPTYARLFLVGDNAYILT